MVVLFWIVFLAIQVTLSVYLIRNKPPIGCSARTYVYRQAAIGLGFIPIPLMVLAAQLVYFGLYRGQLRKLARSAA
jgi:hypothetical protein